jgi:hypothetical protein
MNKKAVLGAQSSFSETKIQNIFEQLFFPPHTGKEKENI